jgi:20S proteasome subunit alpha 6
LDKTTKSYVPLSDLSEASESDETLPPFWCWVIPTKTTLIAYLETAKPLLEAKWVKTGDVHEWLRNMFGRTFWTAGDSLGWEHRIEVVDPDPVCIITISLMKQYD